MIANDPLFLQQQLVYAGRGRGLLVTDLLDIATVEVHYLLKESSRRVLRGDLLNYAAGDQPLVFAGFSVHEVMLLLLNELAELLVSWRSGKGSDGMSVLSQEASRQGTKTTR